MSTASLSYLQLFMIHDTDEQNKTKVWASVIDNEKFPTDGYIIKLLIYYVFFNNNSHNWLLF